MASAGRRHRGGRQVGVKGAGNTDVEQLRDLVPSELSLLDLMSRTQKVRGEGGREEEITFAEAVQRKTLQSAMGGSVFAQRTLLDRHAQAEALEQALRSHRAGFWRSYKERQRSRLDQWLREGRQEIDFFPHPDDIVIGHDNTVRFLGPVDHDEMVKVRQTMAMREAFLLQAKYEDRPGVLSDQAWEEGGSSALLLAWFMNRSLPPRLRWDDETFTLRYLILREWRTRREAEAAVQAQWRSAGVNRRRGFTLPSQDRMATFMKALANLIRRARQDAAHGHEWGQERVQEELMPCLSDLRRF